MSETQQPGVPANIAEMMVAVGRIEEKLSRIEKLENRIDGVEKIVSHLDAVKPVRTPLWQILSAVAATMAIIVGAVNLQTQQQAKIATTTELQILKSNQEQLIQKVHP